MTIGLTSKQKILLVLAGFAIAVVGFLVKLPSSFRHIDKELHAAFYFTAAAALNFLFADKNFIRHAVIFFVLYLFGVAIEFAQDYSNHLFRTRIHGRFDPEDIQWNLKGLVAFSLLWLLYILAKAVYKKAVAEDDVYKSAPPSGNLKP